MLLRGAIYCVRYIAAGGDLYHFASCCGVAAGDASGGSGYGRHRSTSTIFFVCFARGVPEHALDAAREERSFDQK